MTTMRPLLASLGRPAAKVLHEDPPGVVSFTVYGIPQPAGSKRGFVQAGRVRIVDDAKKSRPWKAQVADAAMQEVGGRGPLMLGPIALEVGFFVPRPKGHSGKNGLLKSAPEFPAVRPDVTKLLRAVEDALTGIVWKDDAQIVYQVAWKHYGEPARCEVRIETTGRRS